MTPPTRLQRDMGCTLQEFERWLPGATRNLPIDRDGNYYRVHTPHGRVDILLEERPPRRIASITLPILSVTFEFVDMTDDARAGFLTYFDHYTRRGGG